MLTREAVASTCRADTDDIDPDFERLQRDLAMVCAADSEQLLELGFRFDLCAREPDHPGFHEFIAI